MPAGIAVLEADGLERVAGGSGGLAQVQGAAGVAEVGQRVVRIFEQRETLLAGALRLIERCPCVSGCPACVGPADSATWKGGHSRKSVAVELLRGVLPSA